MAESPSTNADLAARARAGEAPGLVLVADHQTAGRGRLDRVWVTPARSALTFSALVAADAVPGQHWPWLPLLTGVAVAEGVRRATGVHVSLKWPNDVQVGDAKLAGILVERVDTADGPRAVVGVGLNVSQTTDELPVATATSLLLAGADSLDRARLLGAVLEELGALLERWRATRGDPLSPTGRALREEYLRRCSTVGRDVRVELPGGAPLRGRAVGVDASGRLEVSPRDDPGGRVHAVGAGDVVHVRPVTDDVP